jgi:hypothetical protein
MTAPTTAAGRAIAEEVKEEGVWYPEHGSADEYIASIEAEAVAAYRARLVKRVAKIDRWDRGYEAIYLHEDDVLAAIEEVDR